MINKYRFYVGEDMEIQLECFDLETGESPIDVYLYEFKCLLYTDKWEPIVMSTIDNGEDVKINRVEPNVLQIYIPSALTKNIKAGYGRLEVKACYKEDQWKSIATLPLIEFLPNQVGKYDGC